MNGHLDVPKIAKMRDAAGLTQQEAADRAGVSRQRWNDIERGRKLNMEVGTLYAIAAALGCAPCDLLIGGMAKRKPPKT